LRAVLPRWLRPSPSFVDVEAAVGRKRVADLIVDYRRLCADVGPWQYAADLGAHPYADLRTIAYLAVWRDGPTLRLWQDVKALDAIDLLVDAALEGFEQYVAVELAEA
jgi:hypothetical protein